MKFTKLKIDLHSKYRVPVFEDVSGQEPAVETKSSNSGLTKTGKPIRVPQAKSRSHIEHTRHFNVSGENPSGELKLPEISDGNLENSEASFLDRVTKARERLTYSRSDDLESHHEYKKKTIKPQQTGFTESEGLDFRGRMISPEDVCSQILTSFGSYFKIWQRKTVFELSQFIGQSVSLSDIENLPSLLSFNSKKQRMKVLSLVESCEQKVGAEILTFEEKSKLISSNLSYVVYGQLALNRIWYSHRG